jgi:hypothetical protein
MRNSSCPQRSELWDDAEHSAVDLQDVALGGQGSLMLSS